MATLTKTNGKKTGSTGAKARAGQDYKVRDISLAEWGRKEISVASRRCRG